MSTPRTSDVPARGSVLTAVTLTDLASGRAVGLRAGRGPRVLLIPHDAGCQECVKWLNALAADGRAIDDWDARIVMVLPGAQDSVPSDLGAGVRVLADPDYALRIEAGSLVIADEWGEVYFSTRIGPEHALPDPAEVAEWARYIAIQCPECEQAEGAWRSI